jgi:hypothetical protein
MAAHNASLTLTADMTAGKLRVSWLAQSWIPSGYRPSPSSTGRAPPWWIPSRAQWRLRPVEPAPTLGARQRLRARNRASHGLGLDRDLAQQSRRRLLVTDKELLRMAG